jgi:hypothetical protein
MDNQSFDFKNHLSRSLIILWWFKDFKIVSVKAISENEMDVFFNPRFRFLYYLLGLKYKRGFPISGYSSFRLVFIASIIGAGYTLKKAEKDGEVIVRDFHIEYQDPIMFHYNTLIKVKVKTTILKETDNYHKYVTEFSIGDNAEHSGTTKLYYCKPDLKQFSYLK